MDAALRRRNYTLGRMAEVGFITAADAEDGEEEADRPSRRAVGAALGRAVLPRRSSQGARRPLRRQAALRERSLDPDRARRRAAGGGQPRARRRAAPHRPAPRIPQAAPQHPRRRPRDRDLPSIPAGIARSQSNDIVPAVVTDVDGADDRAAGRRPARSRSIARGSRGRGKTVRAQLVTRRRPGRSPARSTIDESAHTATGTLEQPPLVEGAVLAHRQPHRPDQGDGRRLQLRAQQVQPRDAGAPAGRLGVQAVRLHRGDRPRLHADDDHHGRAGDAFPAAAGSADLYAA